MSWPALVAGEALIADPAEQLRRQIHPRFFRDDGTITSEVFKTGNMVVSTTRDAVLTARVAHSHYRNATIGSCFVAVSEVEGCGLRAIDDAAVAGVPVGHAYIDLRICSSRGEIDKKAKQLKKFAMDNGIWLP